MSNFTETQISQYKEAFTLLDGDGDGRLSSEEIVTLFRSLGSAKPQKELQALAPSGADFADFLSLLAGQPLISDADEESALREAFAVFEKDGQIPVDELRKVLTSIGEPLTAEEVNTAFGNLGPNVSLTEFVNAVRSR